MSAFDEYTKDTIELDMVTRRYIDTLKNDILEVNQGTIETIEDVQVLRFAVLLAFGISRKSTATTIKEVIETINVTLHMALSDPAELEDTIFGEG